MWAPPIDVRGEFPPRDASGLSVYETSGYDRANEDIYDRSPAVPQERKCMLRCRLYCCWCANTGVWDVEDGSAGRSSFSSSISNLVTVNSAIGRYPLETRTATRSGMALVEPQDVVNRLRAWTASRD